MEGAAADTITVQWAGREWKVAPAPSGRYDLGPVALDAIRARASATCSRGQSGPGSTSVRCSIAWMMLEERWRPGGSRPLEAELSARNKCTYEPDPRSEVEVRWYVMQGERALGARSTHPRPRFGGTTSDPEALITDSRFSFGIVRSSIGREREIHRALSRIAPVYAAVLRIFFERPGDPHDQALWKSFGGMIGPVLLTDLAREAYLDATRPRGRRRVWTQRAKKRGGLAWEASWQDAADAPAVRPDGLLAWLATPAVCKNPALVSALLRAANTLLREAWEAYGRVRLVPRPRGRKPAERLSATPVGMLPQPRLGGES